jgi:hypothetical protein
MADEEKEEGWADSEADQAAGSDGVRAEADAWLPTDHPLDPAFARRMLLNGPFIRPALIPDGAARSPQPHHQATLSKLLGLLGPPFVDFSMELLALFRGMLAHVSEDEAPYLVAPGDVTASMLATNVYAMCGMMCLMGWTQEGTRAAVMADSAKVVRHLVEEGVVTADTVAPHQLAWEWYEARRKTCVVLFMQLRHVGMDFAKVPANVAALRCKARIAHPGTT